MITICEIIALAPRLQHTLFIPSDGAYRGIEVKGGVAYFVQTGFPDDPVSNMTPEDIEENDLNCDYFTEEVLQKIRADDRAKLNASLEQVKADQIAEDQRKRDA